MIPCAIHARVTLLFYLPHISSIFPENLNAINLWSGRRPVSRRLFIHRFSAHLSSSSGLFATDHNAVKIMNYAVTDSICKNRISDLVSLPGYIKLRAEEGRRLLGSRFGNLQQISRFSLFQRIEQLFIQDEQRRLLYC